MELSRLLTEDTAAHIVSELKSMNGTMTHQRTTSADRGTNKQLWAQMAYGMTILTLA
jgi:hypothetical protein